MFAILENDPETLALERELAEAEARGLALLEKIERQRERERRVAVPELEWEI